MRACDLEWNVAVWLVSEDDGLLLLQIYQRKVQEYKGASLDWA
jgi:hypothetical protein